MTLEVWQEGAILRLVLDAPPVNAIGAEMRRALVGAIDHAARDPSVSGVLLTGAGGRFSAGADITEFNDLTPPAMPEVVNRLEALDKPVLALIDGIALGGGFEMTLGAHHRLATRAARFALPEIKLGLLPGAGATQRLPRLIGADAAIELMVSGKQIDAGEALALGIVDGIVTEDAEATALERLEELIAEGEPPRRLSERRGAFADPETYLRDCADWRTAIGDRGPEALGRIVDCVEAALLLPAEAGFDFEWSAFNDCIATPESRALRHLFMAERAAMRFARAAPASRVAKVGIIGAGRAGAALTVASLRAGLSVAVWEQDSYAAERSERVVAKALEREVERGQMTGSELSSCLGRLSSGIGPVALGAPDLVLECVDEDAALKARLLAEVEAVLGPHVPIGSATSWIDLDRLATALAAPERFLGFHPAPPAARTRLIEIVPARTTFPAPLSTAARFAHAIGKTVVLAGSGRGYLVNRLTGALRFACDRMLEDGATPDQIDQAFRDWGFGVGPYQALDREGLDYATKGRREGGPAAEGITMRLVAAGRIGRRNGQGYYDYRGDGRSMVSPQAFALIEEVRAERGIRPRHFTDAEIVSRGLDALANEGARALADGTAQSAGDIDIALVQSISIPRLRGGPMIAADIGGLRALIARLEDRMPEAPEFWSPAPLLLARAESGQALTDDT